MGFELLLLLSSSYVSHKLYWWPILFLQITGQMTDIRYFLTYYIPQLVSVCFHVSMVR